MLNDTFLNIATAQTLCLRFVVPWFLLFNCGTLDPRSGKIDLVADSPGVLELNHRKPHPFGR